VTSEQQHDSAGSDEARGKRLAFLSLAALGVVYGDIGTSPLYAIRECFHGTYAIEVTRGNILGVLSLVLWALLIVVTIKYLSQKGCQAQRKRDCRLKRCSGFGFTLVHNLVLRAQWRDARRVTRTRP
jgi:hypothetical protein